MSDDVRAIRNLIDRWMKASKAGDTAAVLNMMTDDVIFMTCGREPFGKEEFAAAVGGDERHAHRRHGRCEGSDGHRRLGVGAHISLHDDHDA